VFDVKFQIFIRNETFWKQNSAQNRPPLTNTEMTTADSRQLTNFT